MSTSLRLPQRMTVAEFHDWQPPDPFQDRRWELVDGEPACMAPPSIDHGAIQSEIARLIGNWLVAHRPSCRVITTPGVIPRIKSDTNERVPDLGVTCSPPRAARTLSDPILLIEILSPSNEARTRANVWAYCSIPSVAEVLLLSGTSVAAELLRRDAEQGWPELPEQLGANAALHLDSIGLTITLRDLYATSSLR